jgi:hypothetical protein
MDMDGNVFYMQVRNIAEEVIEDKSTNPEGNEEDKIEGAEEVNSDIDEFFIILE